MTSLQAALDEEGSTIQGIAVDHYQFMHYKSLFNEANYSVKLKASPPVAVGILISVISNQIENHTILVNCLSRQAILGKIELGEELMSSLNHSTEVKAEITNYKVNEFFGKNYMIPLAFATIILLVVLIIYAFLDQFIFRKISIKIERKGKFNKKKKNISQDDNIISCLKRDSLIESYPSTQNGPNSPLWSRCIYFQRNAI